MSKIFGWLGRNTTVKRPEILRQEPKPSYKVAQNIEMAKEAEIANPEKTAKEYRKELDEYYERKYKKKENNKENLFRGFAPKEEGELIPPKLGKTPLEKYMEKHPSQTLRKSSTLSKLRNITGRRGVVAGSRRRKLH